MREIPPDPGEEYDTMKAHYGSTRAMEAAMSEVTRGRHEDPPQGIVDRFGLDPRTVGNRFRAWHIINKLDYDDAIAGAEEGFLCVRARDGASNPPDISVGLHPNYVGTSQDSFDQTYRYYYFRPLSDGGSDEGE